MRNSIVKGEYLAWYSEDITFEHCTIIGTQPLCYVKNLKMIDCKMIDTDLAFERSTVEATLLDPIVSIKNPLAGTITVPYVQDGIVMDIDEAKGVVIQTNPKEPEDIPTGMDEDESCKQVIQPPMEEEKDIQEPSKLPEEKQEELPQAKQESSFEQFVHRFIKK